MKKTKKKQKKQALFQLFASKTAKAAPANGVTAVTPRIYTYIYIVGEKVGEFQPLSRRQFTAFLRRRLSIILHPSADLQQTVGRKQASKNVHKLSEFDEAAAADGEI